MCRQKPDTTPSREKLAVYMEESIVSVTNTYKQSLVVLVVDDAVIGTLGNLSASIGKAKSKKTFNVSAIVASALTNSTILHYRSTSYSPSFRGISSYPNADSISTSDMACREVSTVNCCKICQDITSLHSGCTLALLPAQFLRRCGTRKLAPIYHYRTIYMKENTENSFGSSDETRCVFIGAKVTPRQKVHIKSLAAQCGMTVSDYILSCAYNFKPKARLTKKEAALLRNLDNLLEFLWEYKLAIAQKTQEQAEKFGQTVLDKFLHQIQDKWNEIERKVRKADRYILIPHMAFYILIIILATLSSFFVSIIVANAEILHLALIWKIVLWTILIATAGITTMILLSKVLNKFK